MNSRTSPHVHVFVHFKPRRSGETIPHEYILAREFAKLANSRALIERSFNSNTPMPQIALGTRETLVVLVVK